MPNKKTELPVAESPIADVFEGRHPSQAEKDWAEKTLAPTLEKSPEKPIGARHRRKYRRTRTRPLHHHFRRSHSAALYRSRSSRRLELRKNISAIPGSRLSRAESMPPVIAANFSPCGSSPASPRRKKPTSATSIYYKAVAAGFPWHSICPRLMGYDSDHPASEGEVGKCGVAIDSLEDMEILFNGIDLEKTTVSMTINSPASVLWAMYLVVAEKQGADWKKISGTLQNDILKEYIAQKEYIYPPAPSMRLVIDTFEFGSKFTPKFNTISISGYHIREAGSTALQELAFTLYDGVEYVEWATETRPRCR